jgi:hypothetical protein
MALVEALIIPRRCIIGCTPAAAYFELGPVACHHKQTLSIHLSNQLVSVCTGNAEIEVLIDVHVLLTPNHFTAQYGG